MNITSITSYTPNRQAQNVNFTSIWVQDWVKKHCGLTDSDISALNSRCPHDLGVDVVADHGKDGYRIEVYRTKKLHNGKGDNNEYLDEYNNISDEYKGEKGSKENLMTCINNILDKYSREE